MNKHTPGPWRVGGKGEYLNQLNIEPCVGVAYGHDIELIANARLIAAAPDLLEALESIIDLVRAENEGEVLMVKEARAYANLIPWALFFPALAISVVVIGVNLMADGLKRIMSADEVN